MILFYGTQKCDSDTLIKNCFFIAVQKFQSEINDFRMPTNIDRKAKPKFVGNDTHFSLSHCGDKFVLVFSKQEIGVDLELVRDIDYDKFNNKYNLLANNEFDFFEKWTYLEAISKYAQIPLMQTLSANKQLAYQHEHLHKKMKLFDDYVCSIVANDSVIEKFDIDKDKLQS